MDGTVASAMSGKLAVTMVEVAYLSMGERFAALTGGAAIPELSCELREQREDDDNAQCSLSVLKLL